MYYLKVDITLDECFQVYITRHNALYDSIYTAFENEHDCLLLSEDINSFDGEGEMVCNLQIYADLDDLQPDFLGGVSLDGGREYVPFLMKLLCEDVPDNIDTETPVDAQFEIRQILFNEEERYSAAECISDLQYERPILHILRTLYLDKESIGGRFQSY